MSTQQRISRRHLGSNPMMWLAFGFGSGLSPRAPGTVGTVAALPLAWGLMYLPMWSRWALLLLAFVAGIAICDYACRRLGEHDPGGIVWDEFVGLGVTVVWFAPSGVTLLLAFLFLHHVERKDVLTLTQLTTMQKQRKMTEHVSTAMQRIQLRT